MWHPPPILSSATSLGWASRLFVAFFDTWCQKPCPHSSCVLNACQISTVDLLPVFIICALWKCCPRWTWSFWSYKTCSQGELHKNEGGRALGHSTKQEAHGEHPSSSSKVILPSELSGSLTVKVALRTSETNAGLVWRLSESQLPFICACPLSKGYLVTSHLSVLSTNFIFKLFLFSLIVLCASN